MSYITHCFILVIYIEYKLQVMKKKSPDVNAGERLLYDLPKRADNKQLK